MKRRTKEEKEKLLLDDQRLEIVAECGKNGIAPSTYYEWRERYQTSGIEGLEDRRGKSSETILIRFLRSSLGKTVLKSGCGMSF